MIKLPEELAERVLEAFPDDVFVANLVAGSSPALPAVMMINTTREITPMEQQFSVTAIQTYEVKCTGRLLNLMGAKAKALEAEQPWGRNGEAAQTRLQLAHECADFFAEEEKRRKKAERAATRAEAA